MAISRNELALLVAAYLQDERLVQTYNTYKNEHAATLGKFNEQTFKQMRSLSSILSEYLVLKREDRRRKEFASVFGTDPSVVDVLQKMGVLLDDYITHRSSIATQQPTANTPRQFEASPIVPAPPIDVPPPVAPSAPTQNHTTIADLLRPQSQAQQESPKRNHKRKSQPKKRQTGTVVEVDSTSQHPPIDNLEGLLNHLMSDPTLHLPEKIAETINLLPLDAFDVEPSLPAKAVDDLLNNLPIEPTFEAYFNAHAGELSLSSDIFNNPLPTTPPLTTAAHHASPTGQTLEQPPVQRPTISFAGVLSNSQNALPTTPTQVRDGNASTVVNTPNSVIVKPTTPVQPPIVLPTERPKAKTPATPTGPTVATKQKAKRQKFSDHEDVTSKKKTPLQSPPLQSPPLADMDLEAFLSRIHDHD